MKTKWLHLLALASWLGTPAGTTAAEPALMYTIKGVAQETLPTESLSLNLSSDYNGDGVADLVMIRDDAGGEPKDLAVRDGKTRGIIAILIGLKSYFGDEVFDYNLLGWADFDGNGKRDGVFVNTRTKDFKLIEISLGDPIVLAATDEELAALIAWIVADVNRDGRMDLGLYDDAQKALHIYGFPATSMKSTTAPAAVPGHEGSEETSQLAAVSDSPLELKFAGPRGFLPALRKRMIASNGDMDFDDLYGLDFLQLVGDGAGGISGIQIYDPVQDKTAYRYELKDVLISSYSLQDLTFNGFHDLGGRGVKSILLGRNLVIMTDPGANYRRMNGTQSAGATLASAQAAQVFRISDDFEMYFTADLDGDGGVEIIGVDSGDSTLQVWGMPATTGVELDDDAQITRFTLRQNHPNPFNPATTIRYALAADAEVRLTVYNVRGELVTELAAGRQVAGEHHVTWSGEDRAGRAVPSGLYIYRLQSGAHTQTRYMTLVK